MPLNMEISNQSAIFENKFKANFYKCLHQAAVKSKWIRLTGFGVGVASAGSTLIKRIALVFESAIKGIVNVFFAMCMKKCKLSNGLKQIFYGIPKNIIVLPFSFFAAMTGILKKTILMGLSPSKSTQNLWFKHDPLEKKAHQMRMQKTSFALLQNRVNQYPEDLHALMSLAEAYEVGDGVNKNEIKAFKCYLRAARLGQIDAMRIVGSYLLEGRGVPKNTTEGFIWVKKAAEAGNEEAMTIMGLCYEKGHGVNLNNTQALKWYLKGAEKGQLKAMFCYATMHALGNAVRRDWETAIFWYRKAANGGDHSSVPYLIAGLTLHPECRLHSTELSEWVNKASNPKEIAEALTVLRY